MRAHILRICTVYSWSGTLLIQINTDHLHYASSGASPSPIAPHGLHGLNPGHLSRASFPADWSLTEWRMPGDRILPCLDAIRPVHCF